MAVFLRDSGTEIVETSSHGLVVVGLAILFCFLYISLTVDTLHVSEESQEVLGLAVGDSPAVSELLRVKRNLFGSIGVFFFSGGFFDRLTIFIKFRLLLFDDFLLRELLIFDLGIVKDGFLVIGERNNGSHFTERLLN